MEEKQIEYEEYLNEYAGFSRYQILLCAGGFILTLTTTAFMQIAIFLSAVPDHRLVFSFCIMLM